MSDTPISASELRRELERGRCFVAESSSTRLYLEWVETVGPVRTDTDADGSDPFTTSASHDDLRLAVRLGVREIECDEIPGGGEA